VIALSASFFKNSRGALTRPLDFLREICWFPPTSVGLSRSRTPAGGLDYKAGHNTIRIVSVDVKLKNNFAIAFFDNFLVIDRSKCKTAAQERTVLAHEAGHYMSGAFYRAYSPFEVKEQAEHRAFAASVEKYLPVNEILNCYKMGMTENWEIAEYFNLEEEFVEKAVHYWTACKGIDFNCL
jgi:hypothetical protein